jgi:hypothetical protein
MERRRQGNSIPHKTKNSIKDLVGNEENEYPDPDPNRTMINMTNELNYILKNLSKKEVVNEFIEHNAEATRDE